MPQHPLQQVHGLARIGRQASDDGEDACEHDQVQQLIKGAGRIVRTLTPMSFPLAVALVAALVAAAAVWILTGRRPGGDGRLVVQCHHPDGDSGTCPEYASVPLEVDATGTPQLPDGWAYRKLTPGATFDAAVCPAHRTTAA